MSNLEASSGSAKQRVIRIVQQNPDLLRDPDSLLLKVLKKAADEPKPSNILKHQQEITVAEPPFDMEMAMSIRNFNPHHSTCLEQLPASCVGHGFRKDEVYEALDHLCYYSDGGLDGVLAAAADNYFELGAGALEVVREEPRSDAPITGLHFIPVETLRIQPHTEYRELDGFEVVPHGIGGANAIVPGSFTHGVAQHARFGHLEEFIFDRKLGAEDAKAVSEIIYWRQGITRNRYYGRPRWLGAVPALELVQCATQHEFNFYFNRGVPEFAFIVTGGKVDDDEWEELESKLLDHVGLKNSHQSLAVNLSGEDLTVQVEKLAIDADQQERYVTDTESLGLMIVSAHGVPPILGGLVLPGRAGATNESANAMMVFQNGNLHRHQRLISRVLASTLGDPEVNGGLGLSPELFLGGEADPMTGVEKHKGNAFKTILDDLDMMKVDTMSRMKDEVAGSGQNRDLSQGTAERGGQRPALQAGA